MLRGTCRITAHRPCESKSSGSSSITLSVLVWHTVRRLAAGKLLQQLASSLSSCSVPHIMCALGLNHLPCNFKSPPMQCTAEPFLAPLYCLSRSRGSSGPKRRAVTMMPVSTPKVLVRPQGQRQYEWVDLWESYVSCSTGTVAPEVFGELLGWFSTAAVLQPCCNLQQRQQCQGARAGPVCRCLR